MMAYYGPKRVLRKLSRYLPVFLIPGSGILTLGNEIYQGNVWQSQTENAQVIFRESGFPSREFAVFDDDGDGEYDRALVRRPTIVAGGRGFVPGSTRETESREEITNIVNRAQSVNI